MSGQDGDPVRRLAALDSNLVSDVMDVGGLRAQVLAPHIRAIGPVRQLVGVALCGRGEPATGLRQTPKSLFDFDDALFPGAVVVIEDGPLPCGAVLGGFVARSWQGLGSAGILTAGLVRDSQEIAELGFPMYAAGTTPAANAGRFVLTEVGGSARLPERGGGLLAIQSGDLIIGDADGVSIIPREHAEPIVAAAERLAAIERDIREAMLAGASRREAFARFPRFDHIPRFA